MAAWLGGLAALLWTLRHTPEPAGLPVSVPARFSRLAFVSVTVLVVTGVYQSWRGLGSWQALTDTTYGRTLLAKLAAVTALLLAAACSRTWTARLTRAAIPASASVPARVPEPATGPPLPDLPDIPDLPDLPDRPGLPEAPRGPPPAPRRPAAPPAPAGPPGGDRRRPGHGPDHAAHQHRARPRGDGVGPDHRRPGGGHPGRPPSP